LPYMHQFASNEGSITILAFPKVLVSAFIFDPSNNALIVIDMFHKKFFHIFKLSKYLKKLNLKKLYIFKCSLRFYFAAKWAKIYTKSYPFYKKINLHLVEEAHKFTIKNLNLKNCPTETRLHVNSNMIKDVKKIIGPNKKNILIAPSSSGPTTMWRVTHFIDLMKKINAKLDCFFIIALGSSEREIKISEEITKSFQKNQTIVLSEKTISEIMPFIASCHLSICNDTSFQHLSCQLGVPTLILRFDTPSAYSSYSKLQFPILPKGYLEVNHDTRADPNLINVNEVLSKSLSLLN